MIDDRWWLIDTAEGGLMWIRAETEKDALDEVGTWATGYQATGVSRRGSARGLEAWDPRTAERPKIEHRKAARCNCGGILVDASTLGQRGTKCTRCGRMNWEGGTP